MSQTGNDHGAHPRVTRGAHLHYGIYHVHDVHDPSPHDALRMRIPQDSLLWMHTQWTDGDMARSGQAWQLYYVAEDSTLECLTQGKLAPSGAQVTIPRIVYLRIGNVTRAVGQMLRDPTHGEALHQVLCLAMRLQAESPETRLERALNQYEPSASYPSAQALRDWLSHEQRSMLTFCLQAVLQPPHDVVESHWS